MRDPHDLTWPDLIWSHFSRARFDPFDARVAAAAAAGCAGIGLFAHDYRRIREDEGRTVQDLRVVLERHDVVLAEVETVRGWWTQEGQMRDECALTESLAYELADELGVRYLQAIGSYEGTIEEAIDGFGQLCDRAAPHGLKVGIEWLPFTNIATAADAQRIVEGANRDNGGYCADIWHHERGARDMDLIRALPADKIFAIQMNDGTLQPVLDDYRDDCLAYRVPPGSGEFDCVGFMRTLHEMGVTAPISLEVCSTELWAAPVEHAAKVSADGMRAVLAAATA